MTLPVARDLSVVGVRVNTILPGLIDTPIYGAFEDAEAFKEQAGQGRPVPAPAGPPGRVRLTGVRAARRTRT